MPVKGKQAKTMLADHEGKYTEKVVKDGVLVGAHKKGTAKEQSTLKGQGYTAPGWSWDSSKRDWAYTEPAGQDKALMNLVGQQNQPVGYQGLTGSQYEPLSLQIGAPYYPHTAVEVDPRYGASAQKLQEIIGGKGYEEDLAAKQYAALVGASPQQAVTGAVGAVGSRAGGQIAEARKMSDIQMVQGLAGAKVEARKAQEQAAIAASGELRNIMQQQFTAWATAEGLSGDAYDRTQNQATMLQNTLLAELEAAINAGMVKTPEDFEKWGSYANKRWNEWNSADAEEKNSIAMKMGFSTATTSTEPTTSERMSQLYPDYNDYSNAMAHYEKGGAISVPSDGDRKQHPNGQWWEYDFETATWSKVDGPTEKVA